MFLHCLPRSLPSKREYGFSRSCGEATVTDEKVIGLIVSVVRACFLPIIQSGTPFGEMVPTILRIDFPTSVNTVWTSPCRHAQAALLSLDPVKFTIPINHHSKVPGWDCTFSCYALHRTDSISMDSCKPNTRRQEVRWGVKEGVGIQTGDWVS